MSATSVLNDLFCVDSDHYSQRRVGRYADGGYWFPVGLDDFDAVFSPGVGGVVDFDLYFASQGIPVFQADGSVDAPPVSDPNFIFTKRFLSESFSLADRIKETPYTSSQSLLLQMDIESSEWGVLAACSAETLNQFSVVVVEFHDVDLLVTKSGVEQRQLLHRLLDSHQPISASPNNFVRATRFGSLAVPPVVETVFVRKDKLPLLHKSARLPDSPIRNHPKLPPVAYFSSSSS